MVREKRMGGVSENKRGHLENGAILPPPNSANGLSEMTTADFPLDVAAGRVAGEDGGGRRQT